MGSGTKPKKKTNYRKKYKNKIYSSVGKLDCVGLPDTLYTTLKISQGFELIEQANNVATMRCELNNPRDPFGTSSNIRPRYFNQIVQGQLYRKFTVIGLSYKITVVNNDEKETAMLQIAYRDSVYNVPSNVGAMEGDAEFQNTITRYVSSSGSKNQIVLKGNIKPWTVDGETKNNYMGDPEYSGAWNADPLRRLYMYIHAGSLPVRQKGCDVNIMVELNYRVKFSELADDIARSTN